MIFYLNSSRYRKKHHFAAYNRNHADRVNDPLSRLNKILDEYTTDGLINESGIETWVFELEQTRQHLESNYWLLMARLIEISR